MGVRCLLALAQSTMVCSDDLCEVLSLHAIVRHLEPLSEERAGSVPP